MVTKESSTSEPLSAGRDEDILTVVEEAKAEARAAQARAKAEEKARLKAEKNLTEARQSRKAAHEEAEQERRARMQSEKSLAEARQALARALAEIEQAHQSRAEAEETMPEAMQTSRGAAEGPELPLVKLEQDGVEHRFSFVVSLTVDKQGQPIRTVVEHGKSGKKDSFTALNLQRLSDFMKECISAEVQPVTAMPSAPASSKEAFLLPEILKAGSNIMISDVQVFHKDAPGVKALTFNNDEDFEVQVRFQLHGPESVTLASGESPLVVKVYANEIAQGTSVLLSTYHGNLAKDAREYSARIQTEGLSPGLYRLLTLVSIVDPKYIVGKCEGPLFQVAVGQLATLPFTHLKGSR